MLSLIREIRGRNLDRWVGAFARQWVRRRSHRGPRHLLFALCDHFEPLWGDAPDSIGDARVDAWMAAYPRLAAAHRDDDGRPPRHSFFYPGEQNRPRYLDQLAELARQGLGEVELHLHHDGDTSDELRDKIAHYLEELAQHGHLARDAAGRFRYAFIHGNWCLANARRDGRWCGVDDELPVLFETGCYADFTFPAAPDESQPGIVNQIYWPTGDLRRSRGYEQGERARVGHCRTDRLLMVEGPLSLSLRAHRRPVRIENGALTGVDPATRSRVASWVAQDIHVAGRPEWLFVKVSAHGAPEANARSMLGEGGHSLHLALRDLCDTRAWQLHYVSAREMYNVARAAMDGCSGNPDVYRDYLLPPPPAARALLTAAS